MAPRTNNGTLYELLLDMQEKERDRHEKLVSTISTGIAEIKKGMADHEQKDTERFAEVDNRLVIVENTRRTTRWLIGIVLAAVATGLADLIVNHLSK